MATDSLSPRLCDLLGVLMRHPGQVVGREQIVREVWRTEYVKNTRMLDAQISRLRKLVEPIRDSPVGCIQFGERAISLAAVKIASCRYHSLGECFRHQATLLAVHRT